MACLLIIPDPAAPKHPTTSLVNCRMSQKVSKDFEKWLKRAEMDALQIAKSTETHSLIIGVSKSNGQHSFQLVGGSPTAIQFMNQHLNAEEGFDFVSDFQAFCTGIPIVVRQNGLRT
ncbi:hypothetical protein CROQUDRAFT_98271 [Cronartium quercuum f. sp. fusiforme G11]|uniref:Uncharacterized protein n=1 Tax=Cronartium quercuum f. sp. fusiforme G11 TaxID=708437 RepID=A0A9P6NDP1_9BASI|nr:hypothetical protein CROQUDRAFT_98271 [Cronartium quercuum f. sp. fusiforme G11]